MDVLDVPGSFHMRYPFGTHYLEVEVRGLIHRAGQWYIARLNRREFENQQFVKLYERPLEYSFALECISETVPHHVLDVGAGRSPWPALIRTCGCMVTAIDQVSGYWGQAGMVNRHYHVIKDDILDPHVAGPFDLVTCISVLEHIADHERAVESMMRLLRPGGHLVLTVPHSADGYVENVYALPEASYGKDFQYICQVFGPQEVSEWASRNGASVVRQDYYRVFSGRLWTFGTRLTPYERVSSEQEHQLTAIMLRKSE